MAAATGGAPLGLFKQSPSHSGQTSCLMRAAHKAASISHEKGEVCSFITASCLTLQNISFFGVGGGVLCKQTGVSKRTEKESRGGGVGGVGGFDRTFGAFLLTVRAGLISPDTFAPYRTTIDGSDTVRERPALKKNRLSLYPPPLTPTPPLLALPLA